MLMSFKAKQLNSRRPNRRAFIIKIKSHYNSCRRKNRYNSPAFPDLWLTHIHTHTHNTLKRAAFCIARCVRMIIPLNKCIESRWSTAIAFLGHQFSDDYHAFWRHSNRPKITIRKMQNVLTGQVPCRFCNQSIPGRSTAIWRSATQPPISPFSHDTCWWSTKLRTNSFNPFNNLQLGSMNCSAFRLFLKPKKSNRFSLVT